MIAGEQDGITLSPVPLRAQVLTDAERRRLAAAEAKVSKAEREWAAVVRALGIAACSREMGLTPQGLLRRIQKIEAGE
jgi:hypothetical protein